MKIRNVHSGPVLVGGVSIIPRRTAEIDDEIWIDWLKRSDGNREVAARCLEIVEHPIDPREANRIEKAIIAIRQMAPNAPGQWMVDGRPTLNSLIQLTGIGDLSTRERDRAWQIVQGRDLPTTLPPEEDEFDDDSDI